MQISLKIVFELTFELWRNEWGAMNILKICFRLRSPSTKLRYYSAWEASCTL